MCIFDWALSGFVKSLPYESSLIETAFRLFLFQFNIKGRNNATIKPRTDQINQTRLWDLLHECLCLSRAVHEQKQTLISLHMEHFIRIRLYCMMWCLSLKGVNCLLLHFSNLSLLLLVTFKLDIYMLNLLMLSVCFQIFALKTSDLYRQICWPHHLIVTFIKGAVNDFWETLLKVDLAEHLNKLVANQQ